MHPSQTHSGQHEMHKKLIEALQTTVVGLQGQITETKADLKRV